MVLPNDGVVEDAGTEFSPNDGEDAVVVVALCPNENPPVGGGTAVTALAMVNPAVGAVVTVAGFVCAPNPKDGIVAVVDDVVVAGLLPKENPPDGTEVVFNSGRPKLGV